MTNKPSPFIPADVKLPEITVKVIVLAILLALILSMSNAFLALKIGMLTSASIPAAVISMGILRLFKRANILENNLVQTAASAGEAVAGGIVYTIPALIIIHFWTHFNYWENFFIALTGGVLGVMFSIPLRKILVTQPTLRFPEGKAIAEVLKAEESSSRGVRDILFGGLAGAAIEIAQSGFKIFANAWQSIVVVHQTFFQFGVGFSAAMIGAGYLIGISMCVSIFIGAVLASLVSVPLMSHLYLTAAQINSVSADAVRLIGDNIRFVGIGAMLFAGLWTFVTLMKPFYQGLMMSMRALRSQNGSSSTVRTEMDIPLPIVAAITSMSSIALFFLFQHLFPLSQLVAGGDHHTVVLVSAFAYTLIAGFICCAITAYFSGMVGVSASPGSSIIIAGLLFAALLLSAFLHHISIHFSQQQLLAAEAITIMVCAVITGSAAIANDNMQDLKVGHIVGSTPWKQQVMLLLGVLIASAIIPPVMQLLFDVYGIAGVMPHAGMNAAESLPAPTAAVMAALSQAVFHQNLPWNLIFIGCSIVVVTLLINQFLKRSSTPLSILGVAIGFYLPLSSSIPLFIGGVIAYLVQRKLSRVGIPSDQYETRSYRATLIACGLVAGAALMDVVLAIPFSLMHNPDSLALISDDWKNISIASSVLITLLIALWFYRSADDAE